MSMIDELIQKNGKINGKGKGVLVLGTSVLNLIESKALAGEWEATIG